MKQWALRYSGEVENRDTGARARAQVALDFAGQLPLFQYQRDWDAWTTARAAATTLPWRSRARTTHDQ